MKLADAELPLRIQVMNGNLSITDARGYFILDLDPRKLAELRKLMKGSGGWTLAELMEREARQHDNVIDVEADDNEE
jgi:hypothetical protein